MEFALHRKIIHSMEMNTDKNPVGSFLRSWLMDQRGFKSQTEVTAALTAANPGLPPERENNVSRWLNGEVAISPSALRKFLSLADTQQEKDAIILSYLQWKADEIGPGIAGRVSVGESGELVPPSGWHPRIRSIIHALHLKDEDTETAVDLASRLSMFAMVRNDSGCIMVAEAPPPWKSSSKDGLPDSHHHDDTDRKKTDRNQ